MGTTRGKPMIIELLLIATAASDPGDWACARPLIEKNYNQTFSASLLAARIADECVKPLVNNERLEVARIQKETIYTVDVRLFREQIAAEIMKRRRAKAIPLRR